MFTVVGHSQCAYCKQAIQLLASKGHSFTYLDARAPENAELVAQMKEDGMTSVPQIWFAGEFMEDHIGGFAELSGYLADPN